jgi:hypothetical protein
MMHWDSIVSAVFAFLSWLATVRGNTAILKSHGKLGMAFNGLIQILSATQKVVSKNDGPQSGSDGGSGSGSVSS